MHRIYSTSTSSSTTYKEDHEVRVIHYHPLLSTPSNNPHRTYQPNHILSSYLYQHCHQLSLHHLHPHYRLQLRTLFRIQPRTSQQTRLHLLYSEPPIQVVIRHCLDRRSSLTPQHHSHSIKRRHPPTNRMPPNIHPNHPAPHSPTSTNTDLYTLTNEEQWDINALTHHELAHTVQRQLQQENHISAATLHKQLIDSHQVLLRLIPTITTAQNALQLATENVAHLQALRATLLGRRNTFLRSLRLSPAHDILHRAAPQGTTPICPLEDQNFCPYCGNIGHFPLQCHNYQCPLCRVPAPGHQLAGCPHAVALAVNALIERSASPDSLGSPPPLEPALPTTGQSHSPPIHPVPEPAYPNQPTDSETTMGTITRAPPAYSIRFGPQGDPTLQVPGTWSTPPTGSHSPSIPILEHGGELPAELRSGTSLPGRQDPRILGPPVLLRPGTPPPQNGMPQDRGTTEGPLVRGIRRSSLRIYSRTHGIYGTQSTAPNSTTNGTSSSSESGL